MSRTAPAVLAALSRPPGEPSCRPTPTRVARAERNLVVRVECPLVARVGWRPRVGGAG
ncbi:MAG: hypothetical protein ABSB49_00060 [Polyangia bacterium]